MTVIHPPTLNVARAYLLSRSEVTALVGTRIANEMPAATASPRFPALRATETTTVETTPRVWMRMLLQVDCWATTDTGAARLARTVMGVLRDSANWSNGEAVMGETTDLAVRDEPDDSINPPQPRSIVTGHVWVRPQHDAS